MTSFDPGRDKVAIVFTGFELLASSDGLRRANHRYNEPYLVTLAIDEHCRHKPRLDLNFARWSNVRRGQSRTMRGHGHLVYGPAQPGEFIVFGAVMMESDSDVRDFGQQLRSVTQLAAVQTGLRAAMAAKPPTGVLLNALAQTTEQVGGLLSRNRDDVLHTVTASFLRDRPVPYDIDRSFSDRNDFVCMRFSVLGLQASNGVAPEPQQLDL